MARKHIINERDEEASHMRFDEIDPEGEQEVVDESSARRAGRVKLPADCVVVHYREKSIMRRFSPKQIVKSGGDLVRVFDEESHGEDYEAVADEFIETCKEGVRRNRLATDHPEHSHDIYPTFLKKEVYRGGKRVEDKPSKTAKDGE